MARLMAAMVAGAVALGGCMTNGAEEQGAADIDTARATLRSVAGEARGEVTVTETSGGLRFAIVGVDLPQGVHGVHVHAVGRCDAPDFTSAGPHWNPTNRQHGRDNPQGQHAGDLPNLIVGTDGRGTLEITIPGRLTGGPNALLDADGAAFVVHATADDMRSDPSGNSGARIACGVIGRA